MSSTSPTVDPNLLPALSWDDLTEALQSVASSRRAATLAGQFTSAIRKQATFLPPAGLLSSILASAVLCAEPDDSSTPPEAPMDG